MRKRFQGVTNIIRFNWHFYVLSAVAIIFISILSCCLNNQYHIYTNIFLILAIASILISLLVSFYIYDLSNLYTLRWLDGLHINSNNTILNINAGFDETSVLLSNKYPTAELKVFDFYDPEKHTEVSIKRARKAYPPYKNTIPINTATIPLQDNYANAIFIIFAAHEIRNDTERIIFFKELNRVIKDSGKIIITEHLRDIPNFLAYNIGFLHFLSKATWHKTFSNAGFICDEIRLNPFITTFILTKNGTTS